MHSSSSWVFLHFTCVQTNETSWKLANFYNFRNQKSIEQRTLHQLHSKNQTVQKWKWRPRLQKKSAKQQTHLSLGFCFFSRFFYGWVSGEYSLNFSLGLSSLLYLLLFSFTLTHGQGKVNPKLWVHTQCLIQTVNGCRAPSLQSNLNENYYIDQPKIQFLDAIMNHGGGILEPFMLKKSTW